MLESLHHFLKEYPMSLPKFPNVRTQCEKCDKATWCRELKPCSDFAPAISSNYTDSIMDPEETRYQAFELVS